MDGGYIINIEFRFTVMYLLQLKFRVWFVSVARQTQYSSPPLIRP